MSNKNKFIAQCSSILEDSRVTVWHISLYLYILSVWQVNGIENYININRKKLMGGARIKSKTTYHKCISQLQAFGYIIYLPTYDSHSGTVIHIIGF